MNDLLVDVVLYEQKVGTLAWDENRGLADFQYNPNYLKNGLDIAPLTMPIASTSRENVYAFPQNRNACFMGLPGLIADALPDKYGNQIIDEWFAAQGVAVSQITPLDRLCYIGTRAMGALEFFPNKDIKGLNDSTILRIESLVDLADKVYKDREAFRENIRQHDKTILDILKIGTSAGGAKPKAIIALNEMTNEVRSGQVMAPYGFTYWLLKFDGTTFNENGYKIEHPKGISNIEYAYYKMAVDCGISMSECRLLQERDSYHFMTKRFDRTEKGEKIHMQTLAAMAHFDRDTRHSYEEGFAVLRRLGLNFEAMEEFYRRMVFNVIARNHDDHTKNHSFLMDKTGKWSLAPAYDLCYSYSPTGRWTSIHQMSINGKQDEFSWTDLSEVGRKMDVKNVDSIIERTVEVVSAWNKYAKDCGVYDNHRELIGKNHRLLSAKKTQLPDNGYQFTDITVSSDSSQNKFFIRCKVNGIQQSGIALTAKERKTYESLVLTDNQSLLDKYKLELAEKYFKENKVAVKNSSYKR